jgi:hypothetical protein
MGTRGLTKVIYEGETKVAQYGQWDHYPSGQGVAILSFLRGEGNLELLKKGIKNIKAISDKTLDKFVNEFTDNENGFMTMDEAESFKDKYPSLSRDTGGEILSIIANSTNATNKIPLVLNPEFENDDLFCEGVYTVDLDQSMFISRYADRLLVFMFNDLPTDEGYIDAFALDTATVE